ncbi:MAG TPA: serine/threonine-protein kinase [Pseudomonadota bacterium]|jgi:serine/threonine-protein kinase|nr:serine/threonine-protein kinase [Pseudomonadota bacterium]
MDQAETPAAAGPETGEPAKRLLGTTVGGRYKVVSLLGEGGMGAVYLVEHALMRKRMALKVLNSELSKNREMVARFEREAMAAAHLEHPNVVAATDLGTTDEGSLFLVLEFIDGKSLRDQLNFGPLSPARVIHIARQVASALQRAHSVGIVHRDLKPENIMIMNRDGDPDFVKVLDFGLAKIRIEALVEDVSQRSETLTKYGTIFGTPAYMAPEQAAGGEVDGRTDLYALGVVMYELLTGWVPFDADDPAVILRQQILAPVPPMAQKAPSVKVPATLEAMVMKLLEKNPDNRHKDARALLDALTELAMAEGLRYEPSTPLGRLNIPNSGIRDIDSRPTVMGDKDYPAQAAATGGESVAQIEIVSPSAVQIPAVAGAAASAKATGGVPATKAGDSGGKHPALPAGKDSARDKDEANRAVGHAATVPALSASSNEIVPAGSAGGLPAKLALVLSTISQKWSALLGFVRGKLPEKHRGVSQWALGTAVAAALLLPTFFLFGLLIGSDEDSDSAVVGMVGFASDADMQKAVEKGPAALLKLRNKYPNDSRTHRALVKAYGKAGELGSALQAIPPLLTVDPAAAYDDQILRLVADAALQPQTSEPAVQLLEQKMGEYGVDMLIELADRTTMEPYRGRLTMSLSKEAVRKLASPDGVMVLDLRNAASCEAKKALVAKAGKQGGKRTLETLLKLQIPTGCGPGAQTDCWPCLRKGNALQSAINEIRQRGIL